MKNQDITKALSVEHAIRLHDEFASRSDLALNYFYDGCAHRTHLMGQDKDLKSIPLKKAWAFAQKQNYLKCSSPSGYYRPWQYHIALSIPVIHEDTGAVRDYIFDPALFDGPVRFKKWCDTIKNEDSKFHLLEWGKYPKRASGCFSPNGMTTNKTTKMAIDTLQSYSNAPDVKRRVVFSSPLKKEFAKAVNCPEQFKKLHQGKGWISEVIYKKPLRQ